MTGFLDFIGSIFEFIGNFIELADVVDWVRDLFWGQPTISTTKGDLPPPKTNGREIVARKSTTTILTRRPSK